MRKITIVLLSSLLIIALGACKSTVPKVENAKPALMWFDAEANFERFSNPDSIDYYLTKIKSLGFTHAIVDVRPITGEVLFDTEFAPKCVNGMDMNAKTSITWDISSKKPMNWV